MQKMSHIHILVLVAMCASITASVGLVNNIAGLFLSPMAADFGVGRGSVSLTITINSLICAVGGTLMPRIINKKNFKLITIISCALVVASTALMALSRGLVSIYLLNGIRGFAAGFCGTVIATTIMTSWFHRNTGLMTSIAMGFSGVAGAIFSPIFTKLIDSVGWRTSFFISAVIMTVLFLPVILFPIGLAPEDVGAVSYGDIGGSASVSAAELNKHIPKQTKVSPVLFVIVVVFGTAAGMIPTIVQHFTGVSETYGLTAAVGATMISVSMITNTGGKLLLGFLIDHLGVRRSVLAVSAAVALGTFLIMTVHNGVVFIIAALLIGLGYSITTVGVAMLTRDAFGIHNYSSAYPKIALFGTVSFALGSSLVGFIYDKTASYTSVFWIILFCLLICVVCTYLVAVRKSKLS